MKKDFRYRSFKRKLKNDYTVIFKGFTYTPENLGAFKNSDIDFRGVELNFYYVGDSESFDLTAIYYQPTHTERGFLKISDPLNLALKFI